MIKLRITFFYLLLMATLAHAVPVEVGNVKFVKGKNTAKQGIQTRILVKSMPIYEADSIKTSERGFAVLTFMDNTKVVVRPNSYLNINEYTDSKVQLELKKGVINADTTKTSKASLKNFEIKNKTRECQPPTSCIFCRSLFSRV